MSDLPTHLRSNNIVNGGVFTSDFVAPWWARNRHVQTIFPRFLQKRRVLSVKRELFNLPDGDVLNLAWVGDITSAKALVVMFHGLEGSIDSHYCHDLAAHLTAQNYAVVVMHFRGCGGQPNLLPRAYHSGETQDPWLFLQYLQHTFPPIPKLAIGFSLGANMLLKLLGERPQQSILKAAIAVSAPMLLDECCLSINRGFSRIYQGYLLKSMLRTLAHKMTKLDYRGLINVSPKQLAKIKTFRDFDQHITAPLHGFKDANDYYQRCSALPFLAKIATATLVLHAKDDPFMNHKVIPSPEQISRFVQLEVSKNGGHCGFVQGKPWRPEIWMHQRVATFFNQVIQHCHENVSL